MRVQASFGRSGSKALIAFLVFLLFSHTGSVGSTSTAAADTTTTVAPTTTTAAADTTTTAAPTTTVAADTTTTVAPTTTTAAADTTTTVAPTTTALPDCGASSYFDGNNCVFLTNCSAGFFQSQAPNATSDRQCLPCPTNTFSTLGNQPACMNWTVCAPGQHVLTAGTAEADRTCDNCTLGSSWSNTSNQAECTATTTCPAGTAVNQAATLSSDRSCANCTDGTFTINDNELQCSVWTTCPPGFGAVNTPSTTSDRDCQPCPDGFFNTNGSTCQPWSDCEPKTYIDVNGTASSDRICDDCLYLVNYTPSENMYGCLDVTPCQPGTFVSRRANRLRDNTCTACTLGTNFTAGVDEESCTPLSSCTVNQYQTADGTTSSDRACTNLTVCAPGFYETVAATATTDRECDVDACIAFPCISGTCKDLVGQPNSTAGRVCTLRQNHTLEFLNISHATVDQNEVQGSLQRIINANLPVDYSTVSVIIDAVTELNRLSPCDEGFFYNGTFDARADTHPDLCVPLTDCLAGQRVKQSPGAFRDRLCSPCSTGTYTSSLNEQTCTPWSTCPPGQGQSTAPSPTQDVQCAVCTAGTYSDTDDRSACRVWTTCGPTEQETVEPSASHDRQCAECPNGTFAQGSECNIFQDCAIGYGMLAEGTKSSDRQCEPCTVGETFSDVADDSACTDVSTCEDYQYAEVAATTSSDVACRNLTQCQPGQSIETASTSSSDRVCIGCLQNETYSETVNAEACSAVTPCEEGTVEVSAPTTSSDRQCEANDRRRRDVSSTPVAATTTTAMADSTTTTTATTAAGSTAATTTTATTTATAADTTLAPTTTAAATTTGLPNCATGSQYLDTQTSSCVNLTICTAQQFAEVPATNTSDRVCANLTVCNPDTQTEVVAATSTSDRSCACKNGTSNSTGTCELCPPGTRQGLTTDDVCVPCATGFFQNASGAVECRAWSSCPAGFGQTAAPNATSDRVCTACAADFFASGGNASCAPVRNCDPGQEVSQDPTSSSDRQCAACTAGTYSDSTNVPSCASCPPGSVSLDDEATSCQACTAGVNFQANAGQSTCAAVVDCAPGSYVTAPPTITSQRECSACPDATFSFSSSASACTPWTNCTDNEYEVLAPSNVTDRQCELLAECDPRFYEEFVEATATSDRVCVSQNSSTVIDFHIDAIDAEYQDVLAAVRDVVNSTGRGDLYDDLSSTNGPAYSRAFLRLIEDEPSRSDDPGSGNIFIYFGLRLPSTTTFTYEVQRRVLREALAAALTADASISRAFSDDDLASISHEQVAGNVQASLRVICHSCSQTVAEDVLSKLQAPIETGARTLYTGAVYVADSDPFVIHLDCQACTSTNGFYRPEQCDGLCTPCGVCGAGYWQQAACAGSIDTICAPLPDPLYNVSVEMSADFALFGPTSLDAGVLSSNMTANVKFVYATAGTVSMQYGAVHNTAPVTLEPSAATSLDLRLLTRTISPISPRLHVAIQALGPAGEPWVAPYEVLLHVTHENASFSPLTLTCGMTNVSALGICTGSAHVPGSWFGAAEAAFTVSTAADQSWTANTLTGALATSIAMPAFVTPNTVAVFLSDNVTDAGFMRVAYHRRQPVMSLAFTVVAHGAQFTESSFAVASDDWFVAIQSSSQEGNAHTLVVTAFTTNADANQPEDLDLFDIAFRPVSEEATVTIEIVADEVRLATQASVVPQVVYVRKQSNASAVLHVLEANAAAVFIRPANGLRHHLNILEQNTVALDVQVFASDGRPVTVSSLSCAVVPVSAEEELDGCSTLTFASDFAGEVQLQATHLGMTGNYSLTVWRAVNARLEMSQSVVSPIGETADPDDTEACRPIYSTTRPRVWADITDGTNAVTEVDVTSLVAPTAFSGYGPHLAYEATQRAFVGVSAGTVSISVDLEMAGATVTVRDASSAAIYLGARAYLGRVEGAMFSHVVAGSGAQAATARGQSSFVVGLTAGRAFPFALLSLFDPMTSDRWTLTPSDDMFTTSLDEIVLTEDTEETRSLELAQRADCTPETISASFDLNYSRPVPKELVALDAPASLYGRQYGERLDQPYSAVIHLEIVYSDGSRVPISSSNVELGASTYLNNFSLIEGEGAVYIEVEDDPTSNKASIIIETSEGSELELRVNIELILPVFEILTFSYPDLGTVTDRIAAVPGVAFVQIRTRDDHIYVPTSLVDTLEYDGATIEFGVYDDTTLFIQAAHLASSSKNLLVRLETGDDFAELLRSDSSSRTVQNIDNFAVYNLAAMNVTTSGSSMVIDDSDSQLLLSFDIELSDGTTIPAHLLHETLTGTFIPTALGITFASSDANILAIDEFGRLDVLASSAEPVQLTIMVNEELQRQINVTVQLDKDASGVDLTRFSNQTAGSTFEMPLRLTSDVAVGAIQLRITLDPRDALTLQHVRVSRGVLGLIRANRDTDKRITISCLFAQPLAPGQNVDFGTATFLVASTASTTVRFDVELVELTGATGVVLLSDVRSPGSSFQFDILAEQARRRRWAVHTTYHLGSHGNDFSWDAGVKAEASTSTPAPGWERDRRWSVSTSYHWGTSGTSIHIGGGSGRRRRAAVGDADASLDFNDDGRLTVGDALLLLQYLTGSLGQAPASNAAMDVDLSQSVSLNDVLVMLDVIGGQLRHIPFFEVLPVRDPESDCQLGVSVAATNAGLASGESAGDTTQMFLVFVNLADNTAFAKTFTTQSRYSSNDGVLKLVELPADTNFALQVNSTLAQDASSPVGLAVLQIAADNSAGYLHTGELDGSTQLYDAVFNSSDVQIFSYDGISLIDGFRAIMDETLEQTTMQCRAMRAPSLAVTSAQVDVGYTAAVTITAPQTEPLPILHYTLQWIFDCSAPHVPTDKQVAGCNEFGQVPAQERQVTVAEVTAGVVEVDDLVPATDYAFRVLLRVNSTRSGSRDGLASDTARYTTQQDNPVAPVVATATAISSTSINVVWSELNPVDRMGTPEYYVEFARVPGQVRANASFPDTGRERMGASPFVLSGLEKHIIYNLTVYAENTGMAALRGPPTYLGNVETLEAAPDAAPVLDQTASATFNSLTVSWAAPPAAAHNTNNLRYRLEYVAKSTTTYADSTSVTAASLGISDDFSAPMVQTNLVGTQTTLTGLHPGLDYVVRLYAHPASDASLLSPASDDLIYRTSEDVPQGPVTAINLASGGDGATFSVIRWSLPVEADRSGMIVGFLVTLSRASDYDPRRVDTDATDACGGLCQFSVNNSGAASNLFTLRLDSLEEYVKYNVSIRPRTAVGAGISTAFYDWTTARAAPATAVRAVDLSDSSDQSLMFSITPPRSEDQNGPELRYLITYQANSANSDFAYRIQDGGLRTAPDELAATGTIDGAVTRVRLSSLQPYMEYRITVRASNGNGLNGPEFAVVFQTDPYTPDAAVRNLAITELTGDGDGDARINVSWSLPIATRRNGIIESFRVTLERQSSPAVAPGDHTIETTVSNIAVTAPFTPERDFAVEFPHLQPAFLYAVKVEAATSVGFGTMYDSRSQLLAPTVPTGIVDELEFFDVTARTFRLRFQSLDIFLRNGIMTNYTVVISASSDSQYDTPNKKIVTTPITATDELGSDDYDSVYTQLDPYVTYDVEVTANNEVGAAPLYRLGHQRTESAAPEAAPTQLDFTGVTSSQMTLNYVLPLKHERNGPIDYLALVVERTERQYYNSNGALTQLEYSTTLDQDSPFSNDRSGHERGQNDDYSRTFTDLRPYTLYTMNMSLVTVNTQGTGVILRGPGRVAERRTLSARPEAPPAVTSAVLPDGYSSQSAFAVSWVAPSTYSGPIRRLSLVVEPQGSSTHAVASLDCASSSCDFGTWSEAQAASSPMAYIAYSQTFTESEGLGDLSRSSFVIGAEREKVDADGDGYVNGPLKAGATYTFRLLTCTQNGNDELCQAASLNPTTALASTAAAPADNTGIIVGVVIVIIVLIVAVLVFVMWRRRQNKAAAPDEDFWRNDTASTMTNSTAVDVNNFHSPVPAPRSGPSMGLVPVRPTSTSSSLQPSLPPKGGASAAVIAPPRGASSVAGGAASGVPHMPPVERHEISVSDLNTVIQQMAANSDFAFSEEYECIESGSEFGRNYAIMDRNRQKNRFANILAYDHSRVPLHKLPNDPYSDYINANYIDGYNQPKSYIAAQGPLPHTLMDFWRMIWEQRVSVIVMVTNLEEKGRTKCHRYWPEEVGGQLPLTTNMSVFMTKQEEFPDMVIRHLTVQVSQQSRVVTQFHYISWPDHGVPDSTAGILTTIRRAKETRNQAAAGPMVVHCSAGVGRTGTLIAIDYNLDKAASENKVDVMGSLNEMRRQRTTMVQTEGQYIFIYRALADGLSNIVTEMSPETLRKHFDELRKPVSSGGTQLDQEFRGLSQGPPSSNTRTDAAQQMANKSKNRFQNIMPYDASRVKLSALPGVVGSDYINASYIDGFRQRKQFIATQGPMQSTLADFWRMVWEQEVHSIVMLTHLEESGRQKSEQYWPSLGSDPLNVGDLQVSISEEEHKSFGVERTLTLLNPVSDQAREVKHWQFPNWPSSGEMGSGRDLVDLVMRVEDYARSKVVVPQEESIYGNREAINEHAILQQLKPTVVHCSAGVGRTGAYCAAVICLERMKQENKVDLYQVTKHLRTQRPGMVQTAEQYAFVYRVILDYLDKQNGAGPMAAMESMYATPISQPAFGEDSEMMSSDLGARVVNFDSGPPPARPAKSRNVNLNDEDESAYGFEA